MRTRSPARAPAFSSVDVMPIRLSCLQELRPRLPVARVDARGDPLGGANCHDVGVSVSGDSGFPVSRPRADNRHRLFSTGLLPFRRRCRQRMGYVPEQVVKPNSGEGRD